ncbi:type II secretion system protein [Sporosarcina ureae]|uniref:Tfp assembly type protein n=1 Tax=Sporosarcina ureae TaxID=1571 RepID=A0ABM6JSS7_SPOUR|nr:prepilin-type N-terminal cleavage/methylation domain-containing protein [Sporosarcina ureae]ARF13099.1 hypothetical protein SporoS204_02230 [Sporosarcina ureae]
MKKFLQKKLNQKGLTLVELLAVIVILGIIAAIAVPAIGNIITNTKYNAAKADAINTLNAANMYFTEDNTATAASEVTVVQLKDNGYLDSYGTLTKETKVVNSSPRKINGAASYGDGKSVKLDNTLEEINDDNQKGSTTPETIKVP